MKERGYEGRVANDEQSLYKRRPDTELDQVQDCREGRFVVGGILGLSATFAGLLVGERHGQRLLFPGTRRVGPRHADREGSAASEPQTLHSRPSMICNFCAGSTWLEPTLVVQLTHSDVMGRVRDPVYRGLT